MMLKILYLFLVIATPSFFAVSQAEKQGLEGILVEKYYVAGKNDQAANAYAGELKKNAVTYRIYVDLLPGYRFQAAYGSKEHPLFFRTSTSFFNNTDKGGVVASVIPRRSLGKNTVMLDSWLSVGTASELSLGIPKTDDDTSGFVEFEQGYLVNRTKEVPVLPGERDGLKYTLNMPLHTFFGLDSVIQVFGNKGGNEFFVNNGAWACMGKGSMGVDSLSQNRVLIAQLTTDGSLEYELNIQIGTPEGKVQRYVARNPKESEFTHESLVLSTKKSKKTKK
jgi:hypothetical protein